MSRVIDITGQRFGRLTVLALDSTSKQGAKWLCRCDCGIEKVVAGFHMRKGLTHSCGCLRKERVLAALSQAKMNGGKRQKDNRYKRYYAMLARCDPSLAKGKGAKNYADKGIEVCPEWKESFDNFCRDMGECPEGFELDRIDNEKGYSPENCRWIDRSTNQFNKRISSKNTTGVTGVSPFGNKWRATINQRGKQIHLGLFDVFEQAVEARKTAETEYYGFNLKENND